MSNTALIGLSDQTLAKLRELRQLNVDSAKGFEDCADLVDGHGIKQVFVEVAHERRQHAQALATQIEWNDQREEEEGSYLGALHRTWVKVREACSGNSVEAILAEVQRGEETLAEAYRDTAACCATSPIVGLLEDQASAATKTLDRVKALADLK